MSGWWIQLGPPWAQEPGVTYNSRWFFTERLIMRLFVQKFYRVKDLYTARNFLNFSKKQQQKQQQKWLLCVIFWVNPLNEIFWKENLLLSRTISFPFFKIYKKIRAHFPLLFPLGSWGKRVPDGERTGWNNLKGLWGKRNSWGKQTEPENTVKMSLEKQPLESLHLLTATGGRSE